MDDASKPNENVFSVSNQGAGQAPWLGDMSDEARASAVCAELGSRGCDFLGETDASDVITAAIADARRMERAALLKTEFLPSKGMLEAGARGYHGYLDMADVMDLPFETEQELAAIWQAMLAQWAREREAGE